MLVFVLLDPPWPCSGSTWSGLPPAGWHWAGWSWAGWNGAGGRSRTVPSTSDCAQHGEG